MAERRNLLVSIITRGLVSLIVLAMGIGVFGMLVLTKPAAPPEREDIARPAVRVFRPAMVPVQRQSAGFGTALAKRAANVPAEISSTVKWISPEFEAGQTVREGAALVRLDQTDYLNQLESANQRLTEIDALLTQLAVEESSWEERVDIAEQELVIAERDLERVRELMKDDAAREPELDRALLAVRGAERMLTNANEELQKIPTRRLALEAQQAAAAAQRQLAQTNVERSTIRAPFDGIIERKEVDLGEQVAPGQRIGRIVDLSVIEVPLRLPASARQRVDRDDRVTLQPAGDPSRSWTGRVNRIAPVDHTGSRTFEVYVEVEQSPEARSLLTPGLYVEGRVISSNESMAMIVPRRSLADDQLLVIENGRLQRESVNVVYYVNREYPQVGLNGEDYWAVLDEPLPDGTLVVLMSGLDVPIGIEVDAEIVNEGAGAASTVAQDGQDGTP